MNRLVLLLLVSAVSLESFAQADSVVQEPKAKRFIHQVEAGWMNYENDESGLLSDLTSSYTFSYALNDRLQVGLGLGYERYMVFNAMPIFLQLRGSLIERDNHPYLYLRGGKTYMTDRGDRYDEVDGGYAYSGGLGYQWKFEGASLSLSLGYKNQLLETVSDNNYYYFYDMLNSFFAPYPDNRRKTDWKMQRVEFRIGVSF
jgi:opacity protein-like surface antigen